MRPALLIVVAVAAQVAVGVLYLGSGLVMPYPWVFGMWALWLGWCGVLLRVARSTAHWAPLVPVASLGSWVIIVLAGEQLFGWTA